MVLPSRPPSTASHRSDAPTTAYTPSSTGRAIPIPPSSTQSCRYWSNVISNDNQLKNNQISLTLKGKIIERLESYVCELKRKLHNEQKTKAKINAQLDNFKGVSIMDPDGPKVPVDHKARFEKELRDFMKDAHKRL
jgi:predicted RNase H-like nuclease (RuvC/YqgF family)